MTDKKSYGFSDYIEISGNVSQVIKGETVRIDVYLPDGSVADAYNNTHLSNIRIKPDNSAIYFATIQLPASYRYPLTNESGVWTASATYGDKTVETKFTVH